MLESVCSHGNSLRNCLVKLIIRNHHDYGLPQHHVIVGFYTNIAIMDMMDIEKVPCFAMWNYVISYR